MRFLGGIWKRKVNGEILDFYPCPFMVGDIFITTNNIKPEIRYPKTKWEKLPEDSYLVVSSLKHPVKTIFGENEHTLTLDELPFHQDTLGSYTGAGNQSDGYGAPIGNGVYQGDVKTRGIGGDKPFSFMPKSYAVFIYRRIA